MEQDRWLTVAEIAARLRVNPETVRTWLRKGELKGTGFGGRGGWRVRDRDLHDFMERRGRGAG